jgi:3-deoxy-D-manno-octulosonic-acid transferase
MGPHYENFREAVTLLRDSDALHVTERANVGEALAELLENTQAAGAMGERGRKVFKEQAGATQRAVDAVMRLVAEVEA